VSQLDLAFVETFVSTRYPHEAIQFVYRRWNSTNPEYFLDGRPSVAVLAGHQPPASGSGRLSPYELLKGLPLLRISTILPVAVSQPQPDAPLTTALDLLNSWNASSIVSVVEIDAPAKRVVTSENTRVRELESDRVVAWSQDDEALPLPALTMFTARAAKMNV
jgi:hypothetical protein